MHCAGVLQLCALLASLAAALSEPVAGQNRIIIDAGTHPILNPVDIYSSCCPQSEQNITSVHIKNISDVTPSLVLPSYAESWPQQNVNKSIVAVVEDNRIVLRNVTRLDKGHIYQIQLEYQYNCHHNKTNVCVPYCQDQCALHHQHLESYICVCGKTTISRLFLDYTYVQKLTVDIRIYGLQLEIDCSGCSQNGSNSTMTCQDSSMMFRCNSGLNDASDLWMYFMNHLTNKTAYCRPNQQRREFHNGWVLHRETSNYDCALEIRSCNYEDAGDYQCEVLIPNKGSWVQSETRSISVQSPGPQDGFQIERVSIGIGIGIGVVSAVIAATILGVVVMTVKHGRRANGVLQVNPEDQHEPVEGGHGEEEEQPLVAHDDEGRRRYDGSNPPAEIGRPNIGGGGSHSAGTPRRAAGASSTESSGDQYFDTSDAPFSS